MNAFTESKYLVLDLNKEKQAVYKLIDRYFGLDTMKLDDEFLRSKIKNDTYNKLAELGICLCGGAITSIFTNDKISDLDFYVKSPDRLIEAKVFINSVFNSVEPFITLNAINYKRKQGNKVFNVQLITRFTGDPKQIFEWFDFTVCMGAFDFEKQDFSFDSRFFSDISAKRLVYGGKSMYPICAMYRTLKYQKKGYKLPGSTVMHIALSIVRLEIKTYKDLKEQLMGIDTMYLQGLLNNQGYFRDELPVDYGAFLEEAFKRFDGFQAEDEREELEV